MDGGTGVYVCTLDAESVKKARDELNEDGRNIDGAVQTLRDWVNQQPWLKSPTDTRFLLRFLRTRKYSQLEARLALERYWTTRTKIPDWFRNRSPLEPVVQNVIDRGLVLKLPKRDKFGRIYAIKRPGAVDANYVKKELEGNGIYRAITCIQEWIAMDEMAQVNGVVIIGDFSGYTLQHKMAMHSENTVKNMMANFQNTYPVRLKGINMYNVPPVFEAVLTIGKLFMSEKLKSRIHLVGKNLASMYNNIDMSVLPREYLPDEYDGPHGGTIEDVIKYMKEELSHPAVIDRIKELSSDKYGVDLQMKPATEAPAESFRKLNVD